MIRWRTMPVEIAFHKIDTFTRNGIGNDNDWFFGDSLGHGAGINDRFYIIAINFECMPTKGFPLLFQVFEWNDGFSWPIYLDIIAANDSCNVIELILPRQHNCFPHITLVELAIAGY